jgi:hypothetical protein
LNSSCAFADTPKYLQVQQTKHGLIVNQQWINDCFERQELLSESAYALSVSSTTTPTGTTSTRTFNIRRDSLRVYVLILSAGRKSNTRTSKTTTTTTKKKKTDSLPDFFRGRHFYVSYGDYDNLTLLNVTRVILAYDGVLDAQINANVNFVITKRSWNPDFDKVHLFF